MLDQSHSSSTGTYQFQVGANSDQTVDLTIDNYTTAGAGRHTDDYINGIGHWTRQTAAAQVSTINISGTFVEGDKIAVSVG